jgi:hypothetical protein
MKKLLFAAIAFLMLVPAVYAAPAFRAASAIQASTGADLSAITIPGGCVANDILIYQAIVRDVDDTATIDASGDTWTQITTGCTSACDPNVERSTTASYWFFWSRHDGSATNPVFNKSGATGDTFAMLACYSGAIATGNPFETIGTPFTSTSDPISITAISTVSANALVIVCIAGEDNNNGAVTLTGTNPSAYTEHYDESMTGGDGLTTFSEATRTAAGSTGTISADWDTANPVGAGGIVLSLKPTSVSPAFRLWQVEE